MKLKVRGPRRQELTGQNTREEPTLAELATEPAEGWLQVTKGLHPKEDKALN